MHLNAGVAKEACPLNLTPTASTTAALALGDALAVVVLEARGFGADDFARSHPGGALGRRLLTYVRDVMRTGDQIPSVTSGASVRDALVQLTAKRMGMTAIVDSNHHVEGIFTDGDLRRVLERSGRLPRAADRLGDDARTANHRPGPARRGSRGTDGAPSHQPDAGRRRTGKLIGALNMHDSVLEEGDLMAALTATERASRVKLMIFDVDGVLTDGGLMFTAEGDTMKSFNSLDGHGAKLLREAGIDTAIITGRQSGIVAVRAKELRITHLYQGVEDKRVAFADLLRQTGIAPDACGYMGDDWPDLAVMLQAGFAAAPANSHPEVIARAHWVSEARGGHGRRARSVRHAPARAAPLRRAASPPRAERDRIMNGSRLTSLLPVVALAAAGRHHMVAAAGHAGAAAAKARHAPRRTRRITSPIIFSVSELDQTGTTQYRLTATHLVHYEDDEISDLTLPAIRAFQPDKPIVTATGLRGTVNGDGSIVNLYDNARILRAAGYGDPQMQADSPAFPRADQRRRHRDRKAG